MNDSPRLVTRHLSRSRRWLGALLAGALTAPVATVAATLNVTTYGANGSDANNDLPAITAAIAAATDGDVVYFPNGTYYVAGSIVGKEGVALQGQGRDTAIIKFTGTSDAAIINLSGKSFVEVSHLTLDGNNNTSVVRGILGEPAHAAWIHDTRIEGLVKNTGFGPFGILFSGSDLITIEDNIFTDIGTNSTWGGAIRVGWGSDNPLIQRNTITNTGRGGIFLNDGLTGAIIRENNITGSGIFNQGLSIELHTGVNNSIIEDNIVDHWISIVISDFNAVRRNVVRATDGTYKSYGLEISSGNSIVTDNWVDGGQHLGISSSPARDYTYYGHNRIEKMIQWGLQFQGVSSSVTNNHQYLYKNKFLVTDKDNPIAVYDDYAGYGVRLHGFSQNVTFDSNEISGNDRYGINITSTAGGVDRISFINNTITNNGLATIDYYPPEALHLEWSNNTVSGNNPDVQLTSRGFTNQKPVANFSAPTSLQLGQAAAFTNTSTDSDGTIAHNLWDFGEGLPSIATSPTYIYERTGSFRVTLMTTDNGGRSSIKEHTIVVSQGPPDTQAPTAPANLTSPSKTDTSVTLSWSGSTDNFAVAGYEVYNGAALAGTTNGTTTTFQVLALLPETAYTFSIRAKDAAGNVSGASNALTVTTNEPPGGGTGSILREMWINLPGTDLATIPTSTTPSSTSFLTSFEAPSNVGDAYGARIRGYLTPDVTGSYTFWIASDDKSQLWLSTSSNPANKVLIASVNDYANPREWTRNASQQSSAITLTGGQSYYIEVLHKEGHSGDHAAVAWTGPGIPTTTVITGGYLTPFGGGSGDTQAPTAPASVSSPSKTSTTVNLSWSASTDNVGVTGYEVYRDGTLAVSTVATSAQVTGLTASTSYSFTVKARDAAGNLSAASSVLSVTTSAAADTTAPSAPTNLTSPAKSTTTVDLAWTASTDNVGVTGYEIYSGGALVGSTTGVTSFQVTGLAANTAYSFTVKAKDAAGNLSAASSVLSVTTSASGGGTGTIVREYWTGVGGDTIASIPVTTTPTGTSVLSSLEGPSNWGNSYATRIRGYITPTTTGAYTFYIASDNAGELWLSTGENAANKTRVAYVSTWTGYRQWTASGTQQSAAISLTAGQRYYVEVLHKEASSSDHVSVGWSGPGISGITVIAGSFLSPFTGGPSDTQAPSQPSGLTSPAKTSSTVDLSWTGSTDNVGVTGYEIFRDGVLAGSTTGATSFQVTGLSASTAYSFTVKARDAVGNLSTASGALSVTTNATSGGGGTGSIVREYWTGVSGSSVANIPVGTTPNGTATLTSLEGPSNWGNGYGARIRGYITPTVTGTYTFYIASDNASELWLSTNNSPANKARIAYVANWVGYRQWTASSTQQSVSITLTAGQSYYVEVLHKEDSSADHLSVGWTGPGISSVTVIDGSFLSPF